MSESQDRHPPLVCSQEAPGVYFAPLEEKYFNNPAIKAFLEATLDKAGFAAIVELKRRLHEKKQYDTPGVWILAKQTDGSARDALAAYALARFKAKVDYAWHDGPTIFVPDEETYQAIAGGQTRSRLRKMNVAAFGSPSRNSDSKRFKVRLEKDRMRLWSPLTVHDGQVTLTGAGDIHPLGGSDLMATATVARENLKK